MRFDGSQAVAGADAVKNAIDNLSGAERGNAKATNEMADEAEGLAKDLDDARRAMAAASGQVDILETKTRRSARTIEDAEQASRRLAYASRNLGQQFGDLGLSIAGGIDPARAFGQQAGQIGYALSELDGRAGKVGAFLTGPWGIALTVGAAVLAPFVEKLISGGDAADKAKDSTINFSSSLAAEIGTIGNYTDALDQLEKTTRGLINTQSLLTDNSKAFAERAASNIQSQIAVIDQKLGPKSGTSIFDVANKLNPLNLLGGAEDPQQAALKAERATLEAQLTSARQSAARAQAAIEARSVGDAKQIERQAIDRERARLTERRAFTLEQQARPTGDVPFGGDGVGLERLSDAEFKAGLAKLQQREDALKERRKRRGPSAETLANRKYALGKFGDQASDRVGSILSGFDDTPAQVRKVSAAVNQLDTLIADLGKRKPPGFEATIASAREAKAAIENSLSKPYDDFISDQNEALAVQRLITAGRGDEANALRTIQGLQRQIGPLTEDQRDGVLATVQALRAEQRELDIIREKNTAYSEALGSIKGAVEDIFTVGLSKAKGLPKRIFEAFTTLKGKALFDKVLGPTFRELQDEIDGTKIVETASTRMATAVDTTSTAIKALGQAAVDAKAGFAGGVTSGPSITSNVGQAGLAQVLGPNGKVIGTFAAPKAPTLDSDIVVTGKRGITRDPQAFFTKAIGDVSTSIGKLFTNPDNASKIGTTIGKFAGKGLEGAATGTAVNGFLAPLGKALGFKTSQTGAQIGGAIGSFIPIPGGDIIGSVAGSIIGGLFKKTKKGSATIGNVGGEATVIGTSGNSASRIKGATAGANAVGDTIDSIVQQLGGTLGTFSGSYGIRDKKFVVDTTGQGRTKGAGTTKYGTEEEARAALLADAIADGAIQGISAAMQRAVQANRDDIDKGVRDALKVKEIEQAISGLGSALKSTFDTFDQAAADRITIAKKYGLDLAAVEKLNAEQRVKLVDETLKARVSSLSDFLQSVKFGDLFEGDAATRRQALLAEIETVKGKAEAGEDGASDQLQNLYRQLISTSRDAYGTAGTEFTSDRSAAIDEVQRVIQMETDRVNQAAGIQQATTDAVKDVAAKTDETNDLLAIANTKITDLGDQIVKLFNNGGRGGGGLYTDRITQLV